jgi:hypothetical protein
LAVASNDSEDLNKLLLGEPSTARTRLDMKEGAISMARNGKCVCTWNFSRGALVGRNDGITLVEDIGVFNASSNNKDLTRQFRRRSERTDIVWVVDVQLTRIYFDGKRYDICWIALRYGE